MIASEVYSFFVFALVVGMGVLSHYFLHRLDVKPLTILKEVCSEVFSDHLSLKSKNNARILSGTEHWAIYCRTRL